MRSLPAQRSVFLSSFRRVFGPGLRRALGLALVACLAAPAAPLLADDLGFFESRRILSDADDALIAGRLDEAAELYTRVVEGTESGKGRHARALLGAAVAELSQNYARFDAARGHLEAFLEDPAADPDEKAVARSLRRMLERAQATAGSPETPPPAPPEPPAAAAEEAGEGARIARLERQLAAARQEIAEKEKVIEELRKIVVEGGG